MIGGGAFILLKSGHVGWKSAKQAERVLTGLRQILGIGALEGKTAKHKRKRSAGVVQEEMRCSRLTEQKKPVRNIDYSFRGQICAIGC
jgi:hypothetical protein